MRFYKLIASGFGTGYAPLAPGTFGSLLGIAFLWLFNWLLENFAFQPELILTFNLIAVIGVVLIGVCSIKHVHQVWKHDASAITIDEIAGVMIAAIAIPFSWQNYLFAFLLFRFFDILKPLFIRRLDNMKSDWSVMLDDLLAGVYANVVLQIFLFLI